MGLANLVSQVQTLYQTFRRVSKGSVLARLTCLCSYNVYLFHCEIPYRALQPNIINRACAKDRHTPHSYADCARRTSSDQIMWGSKYMQKLLFAGTSLFRSSGTHASNTTKVIIRDCLTKPRHFRLRREIVSFLLDYVEFLIGFNMS